MSADSVDDPEILRFPAELVITYLSEALRTHNHAAAMLESGLLYPLLDHSRHYRIYPFRLCTNCGAKTLGYMHILSIPVCSMCIDIETDLAELSPSAVNCCDQLNFTISKLQQPYHNLLMEHFL